MPALRHLITRLSLEQNEFDAGLQKARTSVQRFQTNLSKEIRELQIGKGNAALERAAGVLDPAEMESLRNEIRLRDMLKESTQRQTRELNESSKAYENFNIRQIAMIARGGAVVMALNQISSALARTRDSAREAALVAAGFGNKDGFRVGMEQFDKEGMPITSGIFALNSLEKAYNEAGDALATWSNLLQDAFGGHHIETAADRVVEHMRNLQIGERRKAMMEGPMGPQWDGVLPVDPLEQFLTDFKPLPFDMAADVARTTSEAMDLAIEGMQASVERQHRMRIEQIEGELAAKEAIARDIDAANQYTPVGAAMAGSQEAFSAIARAQAPQVKGLSAIQAEIKGLRTDLKNAKQQLVVVR